jgi:hypothetical protein
MYVYIDNPERLMQSLQQNIHLNRLKQAFDINIYLQNQQHNERIIKEISLLKSESLFSLSRM